MLIHFWGVRGSIPTPLTQSQIQNKIAAVIQRITAKDIESEDSRMKFMNSLPEWINGTVGGNTACVEVVSDNGEVFLLDMGSGIRMYSKFGHQPKNKHYNIFVSHFHWDHIQGLPFFDQTFKADTKIDVYSEFPAAERILEEQSRIPYFPQNACWENIRHCFTFHTIKPDESFEINGVKITSHKMHHPGNSYSFSIEQNGKKIVYATDVELQAEDFELSNPDNEFFKNVDVMILDSQYTAMEAYDKQNWGHNSFSHAVDFAQEFGAKQLYFFHHEPTYDDHKIYKILQSARWYLESKQIASDLKINLAIEGQEIQL